MESMFVWRYDAPWFRGWQVGMGGTTYMLPDGGPVEAVVKERVDGRDR